MASFAENFRAGADVVGAGLDRSLRAQQLRLNEARMRLEERQLQQQASLLLEQTAALKFKREKETEEQDALKLIGERVAPRVARGENPDLVLEEEATPLAFAYPDAYKKLQDSITSRKRVELQAERNASLEALGVERSNIMREGLQVQRDRIAALLEAKELALANNNQLAADKADLARELLQKKIDADMNREIFKVSNRRDASGRAISKAEFVTRLTKTVMDYGGAKDVAGAVKKLTEVYDEQGWGNESTTGSAKALPRITSKAEMDKLPSGTHFIGPDGREWVRP